MYEVTLIFVDDIVTISSQHMCNIIIKELHNLNIDISITEMSFDMVYCTITDVTDMNITCTNAQIIMKATLRDHNFISLDESPSFRSDVN